MRVRFIRYVLLCRGLLEQQVYQYDDSHEKLRNDPYLLNHDARVREINPEPVPSSLRQSDGPLRIALKHILPPFGREILRMDREHLQFAAVDPDSISGIASLIDMKRRQ